MPRHKLRFLPRYRNPSPLVVCDGRTERRCAFMLVVRAAIPSLKARTGVRSLARIIRSDDERGDKDQTSDLNKGGSTSTDLRIAILDAFNEAGIAMPPRRRIWIGCARRSPNISPVSPMKRAPPHAARSGFLTQLCRGRRRVGIDDSAACGRTGRVMLGKFDAADGLVVPDVDTAR